jgi:trimeric autotransporter adhesin
VLKKAFASLVLLFGFFISVKAQNVSYNLNSVPITGANNSAFGYQALFSTTGNLNSAFGWKALFSNTTGAVNNAIGSVSLYSNNSGGYNNAIGYAALYTNTSGSANIGIGSQAMYLNTIGSNNTTIGEFSLVYNTSGNYNTSIGWHSLLSNTTGANNTVVGNTADVGSGNLTNATAIGNGAIVNASNTMQFGNSAVTQIYAGTGTNATVIAGGLKITGGIIGAGRVLTSDAFGVATWQVAPGGGGAGTGWSLIGNGGTVDATNFIGTTDNAPFNIRVNNVKAGRLDPILNNSFYGIQASFNTTGGNNTSNGYRALFTNTTGTNNTALGYGADVATAALTNATAMGNGAIVNASNSMQLGNAAVTQIYAGTGTTATVITGGLKVTGGVLGVGKVLTSDAAGVATWQTPAGGGWGLTGNAGTNASTNFIGTTDNVAFNVRVNNIISAKLDFQNRNYFYGTYAGEVTTTGTDNTASGYNALGQNTTGYSNTAFGNGALSVNTTGGNNTALGKNASTNSGGLLEATAIGVGALVNASSKIRLGSTSTSTVETQFNFSTISDGRFKTNISETDVVGLEFIKHLRPVVYNFDTKRFTEFLTQNMKEEDRKNYLDKDFASSTAIRQSGFIAQEVEAAAKQTGYNFNGVHVPETKDDNYSLAYAQFTVPLVKAVQELSKQNDDLKKEMAELRSMLTALKSNTIEGSIKITEATTEAKLYQNAPNPFSKTTTIRYSIPASAKRAALSITTMEGIKIKTFELNSKNSKKGEALNINGAELSAGTYIYTLVVDDVMVDSKKMVLTK